MSETVRIDHENGIIVIDSVGSVGMDELEHSLATVLDIARNKQLNKVLADVTALTSLPSISDLFNFADQLSRQAKNLKHAIVVSEQSPQEISFVETVAINRGARIHIFTSRHEALLWLNR